MAIYKWQLNHNAEISALKEEILSMGFEPIEDNPHRFVREVSHHREVKVGVSKDHLIFYVFKATESATETYFEYLVEVGALIGSLKTTIEYMPERSLDEEEDGDQEDEDEDLAAGSED